MLFRSLDLVQPLFRSRNRAAELQAWVDRLNLALAGSAPVRLTLDSTLSQLPALARAATLVAAALTERPGVLIVDLGGGIPAEAGQSPAAVFSALAPADTTLILSAARQSDVDPATAQDRGLQRLDLGSIPTSSTDTRKALQR